MFKSAIILIEYNLQFMSGNTLHMHLTISSITIFTFILAFEKKNVSYKNHKKQLKRKTRPISGYILQIANGAQRKNCKKS